MDARKRIASELEKVRKKHKGVLRAEDVVEFARNPKTALHAKFCWDDTDAARKWRLHEARQVIMVHVEIVPNSQIPNPTRAYVSLHSDRKLSGGGYRTISNVLTNRDTRAELLAMAKAELVRFRARYELLTELAGVFAEIDKIMAEKKQFAREDREIAARRRKAKDAG